MNNTKLVKNIKSLVVFFSICFFGIIGYLTYFNLFSADKIKNDATNPRIRLEENEVLRGPITDRNGTVLAYSTADSSGNQKRFYNNGEVFAHVTGYISTKYGRTDIELAYNDALTGKGNFNIVGSFFKNLNEVITKKQKKGDEVILTIDSAAQKKAYEMLGDNKGAVAAINPKTGEILALVSKPSFDPQKIDEKFQSYNSNTEDTPFVNRAAQGYYPPGSTFKIITAASALENLSDIQNERFKCTGKLKIGNYYLSDFKGEVHGRISLEDAFKVSCNSTFAQIGIKLGFKRLNDTAEKFMFNKDIPSGDESDSLNIKEGMFRTGDNKSAALIAQNAIGQGGVTTNPLHMALVASAIANGGVMMKPYIVKEIRDSFGVSQFKGSPSVLTQPLDKLTSSKIKDYMVEVVKSGTGTRAKISGIKVAGKTGTAQIQNSDMTHSWFVAFAPADDPDIAVAVIVEKGGTGGGKAAEIAREVIKAYLRK